MKIEFHADPNAQQIRLCIVARERSPEVEEIIRKLTAEDSIVAYNERGAVQIGMDEILRIYTQQRRVLVDSDCGTFTLRARIYELEEKLDPNAFVRISNSEIVARRRIRSLDFSLAGTIRLSLEGGVETYVSRRYVSRIRKLFDR